MQFAVDERRDEIWDSVYNDRSKNKEIASLGNRDGRWSNLFYIVAKLGDDRWTTVSVCNRNAQLSDHSLQSL